MHFGLFECRDKLFWYCVFLIGVFVLVCRNLYHQRRQMLDKLMLAARVIVAIENPRDTIVQSARPYGQRAVLKFA